MNLLIKEGRVLDPASRTDKVMDVLVKDGFITDMKENIDESLADEVIDASGCMVMPGLIDLNAHFREPGYEHKETIRTGARAALDLVTGRAVPSGKLAETSIRLSAIG